MPRAQANGIELEYEERGAGEPLLAIMGLGAQLVHWPAGLLDALAAQGFRVIVYDNRDTGRSTWFSHARVDARRAIAARFLGGPVRAPYALEDMADDAAGLLDALGLPRAHVLGVSMGGMIAQTLALRHPARVRSLTSVMSSPGARRFLVARPKALSMLLSRPPANREAAVERAVRMFDAFAGRTVRADRARLRVAIGAAFDRGFNPPGVARHLCAVLASGDRTERLRSLRLPASVVHGSDDPLVLPAAGRATARAIPGARLTVIAGMGHELAEGGWPAVVDAAVDAAARA